MSYHFSIGADPEVFAGVGGKFISAHDLVEGDKMHPYPVPYGAVQVDGMALEFNIDPVEEEEEFIHHIQNVYATLASMIGDVQLLPNASVSFTDEEVAHVPDFHKVLGCSADYNGYTFKANPKPNEAANMRTAGGHIHIGGFNTNDYWGDNHYKMSGYLARAMDKYVGVPSLIWDGDDMRRQMYGKAGAFRPKKYGMEYRTLSNAWIFSKDLLSYVYKQSRKAVENYLDGERIETTLYQDIINSSARDHEWFSSKEANLVREMVHG